MIDYEAVLMDMDLRYAELYAELKKAEARLYKAYLEQRTLRENPARCEKENVELRRMLRNFKVEWSAKENRRLDDANRKAAYAAKMFWMVVDFARGKVLFSALPEWVKREMYPGLGDRYDR